MHALAAVLTIASLGASLDPIMPKGTRPQEIATGFGHLEGPAWDGAGGLFFVDAQGHTILRLNGEGQVETVRAKSGQAIGLAFDSTGKLVAAENAGRRITRMERDGSVTPLAERFNDKPLNGPNDLVLDAHGGIYFSDARRAAKGRGDEAPGQDRDAVYYLSASGVLTRLDMILGRPEGIALSPDGTYLYVADAARACVMAYEVTGPGAVRNGRLYAEVKGQPGGLCVDAAGRLYVAAAPGIWVFSVAAADKAPCIGVINVPENPTNCAFGGEGLTTLYVTTPRTLYKVRLLAEGLRLTGGPAAQAESGAAAPRPGAGS